MRKWWALFLLLLAAERSYAQHAVVRGTVRDSIASTPLAGATVQLIAGNDVRSTNTDSAGAFRIDSVPPGTYTIGFFHPLLDSIGIESPAREIVVDNSENVIELAVPSPSRIKTAVCRNVSDQSAVILGTVRDAVSGQPAKDVIVTAEWLDYVINRGGMARKLSHASATTNENGWFSLCDVPGTGTLALHAAKGTDSTGVIELQISSSGFVRQEIFLDASSGGIAVEGRVTATATGKPISSAQVLIGEGLTVRTNEAGEFFLTNARGGTRTLQVRAVGFYPVRRQVNVISGAPAVNISMSTLKAVLDTVKIVAKALPKGPDDGQFAFRRRSGMGKYITAQDMLRFPVVKTSDVFKRIPGVRADRGDSILVRGAFLSIQGSGDDGYCAASVFINGHNMSFMGQWDIDDYVSPDEVAGIEVYPAGTTPPQFQEGLKGCGSIVIWTKSHS
jgi:hypothetical protein